MVSICVWSPERLNATLLALSLRSLTSFDGKRIHLLSPVVSSDYLFGIVVSRVLVRCFHHVSMCGFHHVSDGVSVI